jgi:hypothetical protein
VLESYEGRLFPPPAVVGWFAVVALGRTFDTFERGTFEPGGGTGTRRGLVGGFITPLLGPAGGPRSMNRLIISFSSSMLDEF